MIQRRSFISSLVVMLGAAFAGFRARPVQKICGLDPSYERGDTGIITIYERQKVTGGLGYHITSITISGGGGTGAVATGLMEINEIHRKSFGI